MFCLCFRLFKLKWAAQTISTENLNATQIKIFAYPGLAQSGFEQPGLGAPLLGLAKSV